MIAIRRKLFILLIPVLVLGVAGCDDTPTESEEQSGEADPSFGTAADVHMARAVWSSIENYRENWDSFPGWEGWREGGTPHGAWLKYYANSTAVNNAEQLPPGSVIIKENYPEQDANKLGPVTVMVRIRDYDQETYDWFWAKYLPDGSLDTNDAGVQLAGKVAKGAGEDGQDAGCIGCHAGAGGDDYFFAND